MEDASRRGVGGEQERRRKRKKKERKKKERKKTRKEFVGVQLPTGDTIGGLLLEVE